MQKFGIDVSKWQGYFDFARAIKEQKIEYAILKIGGADEGRYKDKHFERNYEKCKSIGLPIGAYYFGHAMNEVDADLEADHLIYLLKGHKFEYPIYYDVEGSMLSLDKRKLTDIIKRVCAKVEKSGYWVGIYSSVSFFNNDMYDEELTRYSHWVASWCETKPTLLKGGETQMWQFGGETNKLRSTIINGMCVDQNYCYVDYPKLIKQKGLNGYTVSTTPISNESTKKTNEEVAKEVINGKWGNGLIRKKKLKANGYNYTEVQKIVNAMIKGTYVNLESYRVIALEVIEGKWGNGSERKRKLEMSGYDYKAIQTLVNEMLKV